MAWLLVHWPRAQPQGGLAGATAWSAVFPFDTIKSVVQTGVLPGGGGGPSQLQQQVAAGRRVGPPPAFGEALRAVLRHGGGVRGGLYRGWSAAVLRAFPANAALFWGVHTAEAALS